ncbi:MAG: NAD(P)-dependent glycerol-3-phosphate dehydrogenase [Desulfobacteraceae bacterium]|nr:NAD(P)-dependent glycerol-3-phosphate dehydrogenase [Desulfobacteraceae bacterium]MCF8094364.1 NAD(P)-dependent glycerol-3-phosphate dehydrogenase [Desulfobacteraceae bacterium]
MWDALNAKIGIIGAGSWGTAIAAMLGGKGYSPDLWAYEPEVCRSIAEQRENKVFLPGIRVSENIRVSNDLGMVAAGKDLVIMVVPSHVMREVARRAADSIEDGAVLLSAAKGIENKTHLTMTGVLSEVSPKHKDRLAVLSGPSFAGEVAMEIPTVVAAAAEDPEVAQYVQQVFATPFFRVYTNPDVIGVQLGGAVKNVIAIASGIVDGLELGLNSRAALITRGLAEIRRLGIRLGANPHTFAGLSGVGDLMLTCTGSLSRNHTVGKMIGEGKTLDEILPHMSMVAEGVRTAKSVYNMSKKLGVEMPIAESVYAVLYEGLKPQDAVYQLMTRSLKSELEDVE